MGKRLPFLILRTLLLLLCSAQSQEALAAKNGTSSDKNNKITNEPSGVISFEKPLVDFGMVKRGQKLTAKFTFKNIGQGPLAIQGVQAACDCTTSDAAKGKSFGPGDSGVLEVTFDTKDYSGKVTKAVTVITNERSMSDRTLTLTATVNSDVTATPPLADFGEVVLNHSPQQSIRIKGTMKNDLKILTLLSSYF